MYIFNIVLIWSYVKMTFVNGTSTNKIIIIITSFVILLSYDMILKWRIACSKCVLKIKYVKLRRDLKKSNEQFCCGQKEENLQYQYLSIYMV